MKCTARGVSLRPKAFPSGARGNRIFDRHDGFFGRTSYRTTGDAWKQTVAPYTHIRISYISRARHEISEKEYWTSVFLRAIYFSRTRTAARQSPRMGSHDSVCAEFRENNIIRSRTVSWTVLLNMNSSNVLLLIIGVRRSRFQVVPVTMFGSSHTLRWW